MMVSFDDFFTTDINSSPNIVACALRGTAICIDEKRCSTCKSFNGRVKESSYSYCKEKGGVYRTCKDYKFDYKTAMEPHLEVMK